MSARRRPNAPTVTPVGQPPMVIDWAGTTDPAHFNMMRVAVIHHSFHKWRARKQRLFACACCRRLWDHMPDPRSRAEVGASTGLGILTAALMRSRRL